MEQQQKEDMVKKFFQEKELEERKKKLSAENYFLVYYFEKIKQQALKESTEAIKKFFENFTPNEKEARKRLLESIDVATHLFNVAIGFEKKKNEFFKLDDSKPETKEIKENLKKVNISEDKFSSIALACCGNKMKDVTEYFQKPVEAREPEEVKKFDKIRDEAILATKNGLLEYAKGNPSQFATVIAEGLRISCEAFSKEENKDLSMQWSMVAGDMLDILEKDPKLMKASGINANQLEIAKKVAFMGKSIKEGLKAVELLSKSALEGSDIASVYEKNKLLASVANMETAALDRPEIVKKWDDPVLETPQKKAPVIH